MLSKSLVNLTAALIFATTAFASARVFTYSGQTVFQPDHAKSAVKAGVVSSNGSILLGTGYSVSHDGTGEYTLGVPAGRFKNCPVVTVSPGGVFGHVPIADVYNYIACGNNGDVKVQIRIYSRPDGALQDNQFDFVMNEV